MSIMAVRRKRAWTRRGKVVHARKLRWDIPDKGKPGRGKPFLKKGKSKKNILGEGFFDKSDIAQKKILVGKSKRLGEKSVQGQLQYVANLQKRTNRPVAKRAKVLRRYVAKNFDGRKRL